MLKAKDPLRTLSEISGNFPFLAPSLTNSAADRQLEDEVEGLLKRYAMTLTETKGSAKKFEAVQLYRKANRHYESSKLLSQIAADMGAL